MKIECLEVFLKGNSIFKTMDQLGIIFENDEDLSKLLKDIQDMENELRKKTQKLSHSSIEFITKNCLKHKTSKKPYLYYVYFRF